MWQGAAKECHSAIFIAVGTGIGAGVILGGKLRRGVHNMCGEIGYMSFTENFVSDRKIPVGWRWESAIKRFRKNLVFC